MYMQHARLGMAPYCWIWKITYLLMYELKHMPEVKNTITSGAILRLFKSTNMVELGIDQRKAWL